MEWVEYIMIQKSMIPEDFTIIYKLKYNVNNGHIFVRVTKGIYLLPQSARIAHDSLVQHLAPYVYHKKTTPELWTYETCRINFTLVVDYLCVKYAGKEHTPHIKAVLEAK